ncbi:hypothetical protein P9G84_31100 [Brevibacillus centrosporus]|uniref:hypothetical protein n=1 Tax=Brevibacillus centrosporus TaxID=54910 RepID=UPI0011444A73|nr:hypothetical protein [Brevibacillus centrosporus]MEC2133305.1 hypothetical protein [Brevibacillus centrosporus]GED33937.1 hypothetical protein BCE02nite_50780 [Brevibacillus centrosporus]
MSLEQFRLTPEKAKEFREYLRKGTMLTGLITNRRTAQKRINGEVLSVEAVEVTFPDNTLGVCYADNFEDYQFESLIGFVGYDEPFLVERVDETNNLIILNRIKALEILRENLWKTIEVDQVILGSFRSMNAETGILHFNIYGQNAWMDKTDWDHNFVPRAAYDIDLQPGDEIELKVSRFNSETQLLQVSRKALIPDPWSGIEDRLKVGDFYSGEVLNISLNEIESRQGYFVRIHNANVVLRCTPRAGLQPPASGDTVNLRLEYLNETDRKGRGSIIKVINRKENAFNETSKYNKFITTSRRKARQQS